MHFAPTYSSAAHLLQFAQMVSISVVHGVALNCEVATLSVATRRDVETHCSHLPQYGRLCIDKLYCQNSSALLSFIHDTSVLAM
ncbi:MAG: hypothetical protein ACK55Z_16760 [bacterium]